MSSFWLKINALLSSAHKEGEGTAKSIKGKDFKNVNNVGNWRFCKENHVLILISLNSYTQELFSKCIFRVHNVETLLKLSNSFQSHAMTI